MEWGVRTLKSVIGVIAALVPILYCCGLLYYFLDVSGSPQEATRDGLGPTLLGLGAVALVFTIPLIVKIVLLVSGTRPPGSGAPGSFDADAVIARYMARGDTSGASAARSLSQSGEIPKRPGFGRKSV
jgi:hypothetical protein